MRTAYEIVRRIAESAMSRHGLDARKLASAAGISEKSMGKLLRDEPVRLDQEQYFNLLVLGGAIELRGVMKLTRREMSGSSGRRSWYGSRWSPRFCSASLRWA